MCNIVKALRDEGKKKKEKNLIYSKCVQKKELYLLYCTVDFYLIFVIRGCLIIMNCKTCMKKNQVNFVHN